MKKNGKKKPKKSGESHNIFNISSVNYNVLIKKLSSWKKKILY
jgi:hypothetical protein